MRRKPSFYTKDLNIWNLICLACLIADAKSHSKKLKQHNQGPIKKDQRTPEGTSDDGTSHISRSHPISPTFYYKAPEQMCQSNRAKWSNRECFCAGTGRCPVSERPIKQHTEPKGRKLLLTGRHQEKRTFQSTHTHTHIHPGVYTQQGG